MDDLLSYILKKIVNHPKEIDILVDEAQDSNHVTLIIDSNEEDIPLIIGRNGRTIKALRNIIGILALKENKRVYLKVKNETPRQQKISAPPIENLE